MISTLIISLALWWALVTIVCLLAVTWLDVRQERRLLALYAPAELPRMWARRHTTARAAGKDGGAMKDVHKIIREFQLRVAGHRCIANVNLRSLLAIDEDRRRALVLEPRKFTPAQRAAISAHWSAS